MDDIEDEDAGTGEESTTNPSLSLSLSLRKGKVGDFYPRAGGGGQPTTRSAGKLQVSVSLLL